MKKIAVVLLAVWYLLSAVGVSAEHFFCCGKLASTAFSFGDTKTPVVKGTAKADNCCKTTKQSFKVKDSHVGADVYHVDASWVATITQPAPALPAPVVQELIAATYQAHGPPERQHTPIYILNCTYRI
ncbi:MAG TPA: hypothetical protein VNW51_00610 [Mucilaginibacter sp.]|jgi:hypothetical protein|nr:hypothetical protein [Mucilaginibacter sp.]